MDKLILSSEKGGNYNKKGKLEVTCSRRFQFSFRLGYVPSDCGWNIKVICGIHNLTLVEDLDDHDILGHLKLEEKQFVVT